MTDSREAENVLEEELDDLVEASRATNPLPGSEKAASFGSRAASPASTEEISELLIQARDSIVMVEDSELQVIARISAEIQPAGIGRDSAESLRDSEVDRLTTGIEESQAAAAKAEAEPAKKDISERVVVLPRTHLLANSIAPTAAVKSVAPPSAPPARGPFWQIVAVAAALVGLGVGLSQIRQQPRGETAPSEEGATPAVPTAAAAAQREPLPEPVAREEVAPPPTELVPNSLAVAHAAAPEEPIAEPVALEAPVVPVAVETPTPEKVAATAREVRTVGTKRARNKPGQLPAQPSREQVVAAMKAAMPAFNQCAAGRRGSVSAQLTVRGNGQVSYALVQGSFAGTREGSCLVKALREVRFPAFSDSSLRLTYPLQF